MATLAWWIGRFLLYPWLPFFRATMTGLEKVPRRGPVLIACNHVSFLDPYFMLWLSDKSHRRVRFLAMAELWKGRFMRFFLNSTHQIPVPRERRRVGIARAR